MLWHVLALPYVCVILLTLVDLSCEMYVMIEHYTYRNH